MVRSGGTASVNIAKGVSQQIGRYWSQAKTWIRGTRIYKQTAAYYLSIKRAIMDNPVKTNAVIALTGIGSSLLFYLDELASQGKGLSATEDLRNVDAVLSNVGRSPLYQNMAMELVSGLSSHGITDQQINDALASAEKLISAGDRNFALVRSRAPQGTTPLQLLLAYQLLAPDVFANVALQLNESQVGPVTASIISTISGISAQLELIGETVPTQGTTDDRSLQGVGGAVVPYNNPSSAPTHLSSSLMSGSVDSCPVTDVAKLTRLVDSLENLLSVSGVNSLTGEPNLALALDLLGQIRSDDVRLVYRLRRAVR